MRKLSKRQPTLTKLSKRSKPDVKKFIKEMRQTAREDPKIIEKFKEYNVPLDHINKVHIEFCDLDVSAKTKDKKIYLNNKMLDDDSKVKDPANYLVHELIHYLQQSTGQVDKKKMKKDYLDRPTEQEAFKAQIDYKKREESEEEAEEYIEGLLDHHKLKGKERKKKKEQLLDDK